MSKKELELEVIKVPSEQRKTGYVIVMNGVILSGQQVVEFLEHNYNEKWNAHYRASSAEQISFFQP